MFVTTGSDLRDTPNDIELFHSTMNKISLAVVGEKAARAPAVVPRLESLTAVHVPKYKVSPPEHYLYVFSLRFIERLKC